MCVCVFVYTSNIVNRGRLFPVNVMTLIASRETVRRLLSVSVTLRGAAAVCFGAGSGSETEVQGSSGELVSLSS